ncbi:PHP domain-containing protein [Archaeoglobus sp.]
MKVDLHIHSIYSDGTATIDQIAKRAKERGLKVIAIVDHSLEHRKGITEDKLKRRQMEIERAKDVYGIEILSGIECGILPDGEIALPNFEFDIVIASIHDIMRTEEYYYRIKECLKKNGDRIHVLGHLHSEMFNCGRDFTQDVEIIDLLLEYDVALEINSLHRAPPIDFLDMCSNKPVKYSIGSDAHSVDRVGDVDWCFEMARRFLKKGKFILNHI